LNFKTKITIKTNFVSDTVHETPSPLKTSRRPSRTLRSHFCFLFTTVGYSDRSWWFRYFKLL